MEERPPDRPTRWRPLLLAVVLAVLLFGGWWVTRIGSAPATRIAGSGSAAISDHARGANATRAILA